MRATADVTTPEAFENLVIGGRTRLARRRHRDARRRSGRDLAALERQDRHRPRHHPPGAVQHARHLDRRARGRRSSSGRPCPRAPRSASPATTPSSSTARSTRSRSRSASRCRSCCIVIYLFLLDWRATLIPGLAMPVALIGTDRRDLSRRLLHQHPDAAGAGAGDRPRRRRRHRRARKHRAPAQRGHGPARRRRARHAGSVLRRHRHDGDARGRLRAAFLPARPDRRPVPRIRLRACHVGAAVVDRGAVALPDAGLAHARRPSPDARHGPPHRPDRAARRRRCRALYARCLRACLNAPVDRRARLGAVCRRRLRLLRPHHARN